MMYSNKFVAALKTNGKVLREQGDIVYLPFGSEYSILLKNLNTVRAQVRIEIDGDDVLNGSSLIVGPGMDIELERFLTRMDKGNRFKFIERTNDIDEYRSVGLLDGLICIEFQFEKVVLQQPQVWPNTAPWHPTTLYCADGSVTRSVVLNSVATSYSTTDSFQRSNDVGITVPGSISEQKFQTVSSFALDPTVHSMVLQLKGETEYNKVVKKPVTVKAKPKCVTCGRVNKATSKFCTNCGTALEIV